MLQAPAGGSDLSVQQTNDDAQISKLSCVKLGYFADRFLHHFVRRAAKRAPLINRGYYARFAAYEQLTTAFLQRCRASGCSQQCQILSLGAGFDSTFWRLQAAGNAPSRYFEVDFAEVTARKAAIIAAKPELQQLIGTLTPQAAGAGSVHTDRYCLLPGDLRDPQAVLAQLQEAGFSPQAPTLVLAECVLVYMEPQHSRALVAALGALMPTAALVIYEQAADPRSVQIKPDDAFGQQMLLNLESRGAPLKGIHGTPSLAAHESRLLEGSWQRAHAVDMGTVYAQHLDPIERRRVERLEIFDEFEEWNLIQAHYCLAIGFNDAQGLLSDFQLATFAPQRRPFGA